MTAAAANQAQGLFKASYMDFTLTAGQVAYQNTTAVVNTAAGTGTLLAGTYSGTTYAVLGLFDEYVDATLAAKTVRVNFLRERTCKWFTNDTASGAIAATDLGKMAFALDDKTATITSTSKSPLGQILGVDATKGVLIDIDTTPVIVAAAPTISDFTSAAHTHQNAANGGAVRMQSGATLSFTGVTCSMTASNWSHYKVPATGTQASKIVVAATGTRGDVINFTANGTDNTQTVTYYSGTYAMTTALTASKTHRATATFDGSNWIFDAVVGP